MKKKLISRKQADRRGLVRFYTGVVCFQGHISERWAKDGACIECKIVTWRRWAARNPKDYARHRRATYARNKAKYVERARKWRKANPERVRELVRLRAERAKSKRQAVKAETNAKRIAAGMYPIRTTSEARALGEKFYYTGKPCKHGHDTLRYTCTRACVACRHDMYAEKRRAKGLEPKPYDFILPLTYAAV